MVGVGMGVRLRVAAVPGRLWGRLDSSLGREKVRDILNTYILS